MRYLDQIANEEFDMTRARDRAPRAWRPALPAADDEVALAAYCRRVKERAEEQRMLRDALPESVMHGLLMNEVDYVQFTGRKDEQGKRIRVHYWQAPMLLDNIVVAFCGRDVGKTTTLKWSVEHRATNFPTGSIIITGNQDERVKKVWGECVMKEMRTHWWAKHFFSTVDGAASSRNPYHQWFENGFMLYGRPASEQTARKVESPHCHGVVIDEMQEYSRLAWEKLQPAVNDYESNIEHGALRKFFGVNSEGRIDNVFYEIAHRHSVYRLHRYTIASWMNPKYNLTRHREYLEAYDWSIESSRFKQMIRGLTGERSKGLIPAEDFHRCCLQAKEFLDLKDRNLIRVDKSTWLQAGGDPEQLFTRRFNLPVWGWEHDFTVLSMDYGSSEPSEIGIWHRVINPSPEATDDNRYLWALWQRITLQGVQAQDQAFIVDYLTDYYKVDWLAIDSTGATDVVSQILTDVHNPIYAPKEYGKKLYPAVSNKFIAVRYELEEPPDKNLCPAGTRWRKVELAATDGLYRLPVWALEQNSNVLSSNFVAQLIAKHVLAITGADSDLQGELLSIVEKINPGVQPKYEGAHGLHRFSMMRSFAQWYHQFFVLKEKQREILGDDEEQYNAGWGSALVSAGRVKVGERGDFWKSSNNYA